MESLEKILSGRLEKREEKGLLRKLSTEEFPFDFASNDYLGLARNEELANNIQDALLKEKTGNGSTGSRLISGNYPYFSKVEIYLATLHRAESALLFNSGYSANLAVLSSIPLRGDTIIMDELCHASLIDGARLSFADKYSFRHNDLSDLKKKIEKAKGNVYVVVESIYSMDGDAAPLKEISQICKEKGCFLIVDEAHSTGIYGVNGAGLVVDLGKENEIAIRINTFGKAIGAHGAAVVGSEILKSYLVNHARSFIYTTALPIHSVVGIFEAYQFLEKNNGLVSDLNKKIELFKSGLKTSIAIVESSSPIQAILISGNEKVRYVATALQEKGFFVKPIMSPTVKVGSERLRICLHTYNSDEEIRQLTSALNERI